MRGLLWIGATIVAACVLIIEAGQFAPYTEPSIARAVGAFSNPTGVKGEEVEVRFYRGLGGRFWGCGVDCIAASAARECGVRTYVGSHWFGDAVPQAKKVAIVGASMGADKAIRVATDLEPRRVDLLLTIDPTPFVDTKPKNVVDHINWQNTLPLQLGGAIPPGTIATANIAVPMNHVALINSQLVHDRAVREICKLVTG
jgi:hypothetical protein